jgi:hypothetical protein
MHITVTENRPVLVLMLLVAADIALVRGMIILLFLEPFGLKSFLLLLAAGTLLFVVTRQLLLLLFNKRSVTVAGNRVIVRKGLFTKTVPVDENSRVLFYRFVPDKMMAIKDGFLNDYYVFLKRQVMGLFNLNADVKILVRNANKEALIAKNLSLPDAMLLSNYLNRFTKTEMESRTY